MLQAINYDESIREEIQRPPDWIKEHGDSLFRFAIMRVNDENLAADLVQNTLLAAIVAKDSFQGKSSVKTWLLGILKHKIMDHFRLKKKESVLQEAELDSLGPSDFSTVGTWSEKPKSWNMSPEKVLENENARRMLWDCIESLPTRMRLLCVLREIDGESTETICEKMNLSVSNFSVLLYRTRHKLRAEFSARGIQTLGSL